MSEGEKVNSAGYLTDIRFGPFRFTRSEIRLKGSLYMERWILEFGKRRRSLRLHVIHRADEDQCLHDHPWYFFAFVLWGGYVEEVPAPDTTPEEAESGFPRRELLTVKPGRVHYRPLSYKHRITRLLRDKSVTLAYAGPLDQEWGFHTRYGKVYWENFVAAPGPNKVFWCDVRK